MYRHFTEKIILVLLYFLVLTINFSETKLGLQFGKKINSYGFTFSTVLRNPRCASPNRTWPPLFCFISFVSSQSNFILLWSILTLMCIVLPLKEKVCVFTCLAEIWSEDRLYLSITHLSRKNSWFPRNLWKREIHAGVDTSYS